MKLYKNCLIVFGGMGARRFNEIHEISISGNKWKKVEIKSNFYEGPQERFGHSLVLYKNYLVLFGGAGNYIEKLKVHESYKDVRVYDILT